MSFSNMMTRLSELMKRPISLVGETGTTIGSLVVAVGVLLATIMAARALGKAIRLAFHRAGVTNEGTVEFYARFARLVVFILGLGLAVHSLGIDLTAFFTAGGLIAVALGFAMKNVVESFVSGVILSLEGSIQVGDVLVVEGEFVKVRRMGVRSTLARGRNDEDLVIPNSVLVQSTVKNLTLKDDVLRLRTEIGVEYASDMKLVYETLLEAAKSITWRAQEREPRVLLTGFGDSSVNFEVSVWIEDPWETLVRRSDLNLTLWWALQDRGITIAFPQLDVHFDAPVDSPVGGAPEVG